MQTRTRNPFTTIHTEGALLPSDLLQRILDYDKSLPGLTPEAYHLSGEKLNEAINRSWNRLQGAWAAFGTSRNRLGEGDAGTGLTRDRWLYPLFDELDFGRLQVAKGLEIDGKPYAISHMWARVPIHLVGCGVDLEKRSAGVVGASKASPHSLLQEYLNRSTDAQWGLVSNGLRLRVLRDNATLTRQAFLEFDLEAMFDGEVYADFALLWIICHQSRLETPDGATDCALEQWSKSAQEQGTRALTKLRAGVEQAIAALGSGFLKTHSNQKLRSDLRSGALATQDYYRQLLRLVYRLIFLFVAEDRDLLFDPTSTPKARERYLNYYSLQRLRRLAARTRGSRHPDLYESLKQVMDLLAGTSAKEETRVALGLPILGGFLFSDAALPDLDAAELENEALLAALRYLTQIDEGSTRRAVDYKNLGSEELGGIYESLLELHPLINTDSASFELASVAGNERKETGSYYTPSSLIQVLLDSALDPVIEQAIEVEKASSANQVDALLNLKVCDPACGSGHFLVAASHRIARRLAQIRSGEGEPAPEAMRTSLREVISHCIYGVDINPMSVELCKVSLWMEAIEPGKPLSFLDAHIQCGDSLVGVSPDLNISEIPDEAFNPAFSDDKATASALKKRNKRERGGQFGLFGSMRAETSDGETQNWLAEHATKVDALPEDTAEQVQAKAVAYTAMQHAEEFNRKELEYNLWTAAFFWHITKGEAETLLAPTQQALVALRENTPLKPALLDKVHQMGKDLNFLHWELAFPKVFAGDNPGFDCVLGNPPWEMVQLDPQEFFATSAPDVANALNMSVREKMIEQLAVDNPALFLLYQTALHDMEAQQKFIHESRRFPYTSYGRINLMALFAELCLHLISPLGKSGIVIPTGIATDSFNQYFFQNVTQDKRLVKLIGFENEDFIFPGIANVVRFCLFVVGGKAAKEEKPTYAFYLRKFSQLTESHRFFELSTDDLKLLNPNTGTCPIFRNKTDAELTKAIYSRVPILVEETREENPWGFKGTLMFMMNTDSKYFSIKPQDDYLPLYEGKLIWHYDHRFGSYDLKGVAKGKGGRGLPDTPLSRYEDPNYTIQPQYWVPRAEVLKRIPEFWKRDWLIAFRDVTSSKLERTAVFSLIPKVGVGHKAPIALFSKELSASIVSCFLANVNSLVFDFVTRQKIGGTSLSFFILNQLPILPPNAYNLADIDYIAPRVIELVFTAYDLKSFAEDMGYHGEPFRWDEERRALLRSELDAYYAKLYGLTRDELRYILDPKEVYGEDFPGETFRVLKEKEMRLYGEYRTRRLVLESWDKLEGIEVSTSAVLSSATSGLSTATSGLSSQTGGQSSATGGLSSAIGGLSSPTSAHPSVTGGLSAATDGLSLPLRELKPVEENPAQPSFSDFGLYECLSCGKRLMGFDQGKHIKEAHAGKGVEWKKIR